MGHVLVGAVKMVLAVQATQATVVGIVRDEKTSQPLAGAVVALTDLHRAAATDADGRYVLRLVPAGPQHITVRFIGYAQRSLHALVPRDGQLEINVSLPPEPVHLRTVEVRAAGMVPSVGSDDRVAFPDRGISLAAVRHHPLLAEPDAFQALEGGEVVVRPESPSGVHVRGGSSDHTAYLLDGIPVLSPYHAAGVFSAWNPDALAGLELWSATPSPAHPHTLAGAVEGVTRSPGDGHSAQGSVSTMQARLTLDGPLGVAGAGYLVSLRSGFPGAIAPKKEASYVRGETGDWLAKLEAPAFGGRVRLLGYESGNEISTASVTAEDGSSQASRRNALAWHSQSLGAEWRGVVWGLGVRVLGWRATGAAGSAWAAEVARVNMSSARRDQGLLLAVEHGSDRATTIVGMRVEHSRTSYRIESDSTVGPAWGLSAGTGVAAAFAQHWRRLGQRTDLKIGGSVAAMGRDLHLGPHAQLCWRPTERLALSASYARLHQFAQSLRNAESVVGNVFPADLYIGAGAPGGVPVARSDQGVIAADYRPWAGVRVGVQAYERRTHGLVLVAPRDGEPFTTGAFAVGSGVSRGVSVNADMSTTRYAVVASYGLQRVRLSHADSSYVPDHGATHLLQGGVIVFPTATSSIRLGVTGALGRRTTTVSGGLEWEACNLLDQGCEFGGSPYYEAPLGGTALPAYLRVDLGFRKHWHFGGGGGRDVVVALFGTVTNVLGRKNVLTYARDPSTGQLGAIEMRPRGPLLVGLDWQF